MYVEHHDASYQNSDLFLDSDVETLRFALWRNITAATLVLILVAQSVRLFLGVVNEKFAVRETWDQLGFDIRHTLPLLYFVSSILWTTIYASLYFTLVGGLTRWLSAHIHVLSEFIK